jgi:uncharacterized tellurite resistance protein B-like protein
MSLLKLLKLNLDKNPGNSSTTATVRNITQALDQLDMPRARYIAAFAYILNRAARADLSISPEETQAMENIVMKQGRLPEEQAIIVVQMAKTQSLLFSGTENYLVTREFKELSGYKDRIALLDCLFSIAAAQHSISTIEDNEISQIADELRIEHRDFISIRSKFRDHLAVLKKTPASPKIDNPKTRSHTEF